MIRAAADFGFKVYYGDGTRLDVLHAAGAAEAGVIAVCVDDKEATTGSSSSCKAEFPLVPLLVRSFDREHALELVHAGVDYQMRETFESALALGEAGAARRSASRPRTRRRSWPTCAGATPSASSCELAGGIYAGRDLFRNNAAAPAGDAPA